jgi:hypothetical protein
MASVSCRCVNIVRFFSRTTARMVCCNLLEKDGMMSSRTVMCEFLGFGYSEPRTLITLLRKIFAEKGK